MVPSLASIKDAWASTTNHESILQKVIIIAATAVIGFVIIWQLVDIWRQMFGYSSLITYFTGLFVFLTLYFCLSYVAAQIRN